MKLQDLNTQQLKAVQTVNKPVLVFAGAGSGKTRVLTYKVWHLIKEKLFKPEEILALTFTNKAAAEMKLRIQESISCDGVNVGTFHSIGARMLRMHISTLDEGYNSSFTIYDTSDQKSVIKEVVENLNLSEFKELNVGFLKVQIDKFKNDNLSIKDVESKAQTFEDEKIVEVYKAYCEKLKSNNALDFNDLILLPIRLLKENAKILNFYQSTWKYVLVDEFQDTNSPQFEIVSLLAGKHQNITVVGDDDQSIYGWRGANIDNILNDLLINYNNARRSGVTINLGGTGNSPPSAIRIGWLDFFIAACKLTATVAGCRPSPMTAHGLRLVIKFSMCAAQAGSTAGATLAKSCMALGMAPTRITLIGTLS